MNISKAILILAGVTAIWLAGFFIGSDAQKTFNIISTLFSGLAFAGVIITILLQSQELALQRQELKETRRELKRSADAQEKSEQALTEQLKTLKHAAVLDALSAACTYHTAAGYATMNSGNQLGLNSRKRAEELVKNIEVKINEVGR